MRARVQCVSCGKRAERDRAELEAWQDGKSKLGVVLVPVVLGFSVSGTGTGI